MDHSGAQVDFRQRERANRPFRSVLEGVQDFLVLFSTVSSIHGLNYLGNGSLHVVERLVWLAVVAFAMWGTAKLSYSTWTRYQENPTVVSMDRNYKDWNTSFPAAAICPTQKVDEAKLKEYVEKEFPGIEDKDIFIEFMKELSNATYGSFGDVTTMTDSVSPSNYWKILWRSAFPFHCDATTTYSDFFQNKGLDQIMTEIGICYSFNSITTIYNNPKLWESKEWKYKRGLEILQGSPLDGDILAQLGNMNSGYGVYIMDSTEFPDVSIPVTESGNNSLRKAIVTALTIVSTEDVEALSLKQRKCRLHHESNLFSSPVYSYNLCRIECRMQESYRLCKCIPHFYRPVGKYPVCDLKGLHCLDRHSDRLIRMIDPVTNLKIPCNCLQLCNEVNYVVIKDDVIDWPLGTNFEWGIIKYPKFRLKRDILFGKTDLLVAIGGTAGLFLGCSLLSFVEFIYFFTLRLVFYIMGRNKITR